MYYSVLILLCDREGWSCSFNPPSCCSLLPPAYPHPRKGGGSTAEQQRAELFIVIIIIIIEYYGAGDGIHSLAHTRQLLYHWIMPPAMFDCLHGIIPEGTWSWQYGEGEECHQGDSSFTMCVWGGEVLASASLLHNLTCYFHSCVSQVLFFSHPQIAKLQFTNLFKLCVAYGHQKLNLKPQWAVS